MPPPYDAATRMARLAGRVRGYDDVLPPLFAMTDPVRTPDPLALAARLTPGTGLVYRHFGAPDRFETASRLAELSQEAGLFLLIAADPGLADAVGADGVHWPERLLPEAARRRVRGGQEIVTASAHSFAAASRAAMAGVDAIFYSTVFASASPSAGRPHGPFAAATLARRAGVPVYALGGITQRTGKRLIGLGFAGICCVGGLTGN